MLGVNRGKRFPYLLDQHVQVLRHVGGKACKASLCQHGDHTEALFRSISFSNGVITVTIPRTEVCGAHRQHASRRFEDV